MKINKLQYDTTTHSPEELKWKIQVTIHNSGDMEYWNLPAVLLGICITATALENSQYQLRLNMHICPVIHKVSLQNRYQAKMCIYIPLQKHGHYSTKYQSQKLGTTTKSSMARCINKFWHFIQ